MRTVVLYVHHPRICKKAHKYRRFCKVRIILVWHTGKGNLISKRPTAFIRVRSVIFSLIKTEEIIRSLSCKNPFCAIVKGLRLFKASEEQIPTAMSEETTKRVNYYKNGNLPLFCIEKDTRVGVLYAPFACVPVAEARGFEPLSP